MQQMKRAAMNTQIVATMCWRPLYGESRYAMALSAMAASGRYSQRLYSRGASKHTMKLSRYTTSGRIQRNGTAATSCVRYVVTPSRRIEAQAASATQRTRNPVDGAASPIASVPRLGASAAPELFQLAPHH